MKDFKSIHKKPSNNVKYDDIQTSEPRTLDKNLETNPSNSNSTKTSNFDYSDDNLESNLTNFITQSKFKFFIFIISYLDFNYYFNNCCLTINKTSLKVTHFYLLLFINNLEYFISYLVNFKLLS